MMPPPRGPRSALCVVKVTTSAYGTAEGMALPAIRPTVCATSAISQAPTSSAMPRNAEKSISLG